MGLNRMSLLCLLLVAILCLAKVNGAKIDCYPIEGATKEKCEALGCVWSPVKQSGLYQDERLLGLELPQDLNNAADVKKSRVDEPWCYFQQDYVGYKVVNSSQYEIKLQRVRPSALQSDVKNLLLRLTPHSQSRLLRIQILDADKPRFEPELPELNLPPELGLGVQEDAANESDGFSFKVEPADQKNGPQNLVVRRNSNGAVLFSSDLTKMIYSDKFIQLNSALSSPFVFGLGEHYDTFLKFANAYKTYSFYNSDRLTLPGGTRSYGGFPFFVNLDSANYSKAHGIYLRNSNAMDIVLQNDLSVTFRPIGGVIDLFLFFGPTPLEVTSQFQQLVGRPDLPPRWSLGFHLCRYNYKSLARTREIWQRTRDAGIPFDVQWNDIDYMQGGNDFTYDHVAYKGLPEFVVELYKHNMHYMLIFDPGVSQEENYYPYTLGKQMDIFVKNATNQPLVGKVWNRSGRTVFPDFSNPMSHNYWAELFKRFHDEVNFDGAWIDMNDISNFVDGSLDGCPMNEPLEQPPYVPGGEDLQRHSLCLSAKHMAGSEYNVHNLYSFYEAIATKYALEFARPGKRSLIISRSTHPGQGQFGGHWSGDVRSNWGYLRWSIPSLLEHNMYGFTMIGSDICGFAGNTTVPLCARWSTLGAFYTFSRNHNDELSIDQDPVALGPMVVSANKQALTKRYSLLPYLYTLVHKATLLAQPVARSMTFEFFDQHDLQALKAEDQFMWGSGLLIAPIVEDNSETKYTYLPHGRWYELDLSPGFLSFDVKQVRVPTVVNSHSDDTQKWHRTEGVALDNLPLFYRGGHIIPIYADVRSTIPDTVAQPIALEIPLCNMERAHGDLILDDGESLTPKTNYLKMLVQDGKLLIDMERDDYAAGVEFGQVKVYGLSIKVSRVRLTSSEKKNLPFKQKEHMLMFDLAGAKVRKNQPINVEWS